MTPLAARPVMRTSCDRAADGLALLGEHHDLVFVGDAECADDLVRLDCDDTGATTGLNAVVGEVSALAEAVGTCDQQLGVVVDDFDRDDLILLVLSLMPRTPRVARP